MKLKDEILKLRAEGNTYSQITSKLGCAKSTISYHCGKKGTGTWKQFKYTKEVLEPVVKRNISYASILKELGFNLNAGRYSTLKKYIEKFKIEDSHLTGQSWAKGMSKKLSFSKEKFIQKVLKMNGNKWGSHKIKLKLYEFNLKEEKCEKCTIIEWNGKSLSLHLHHLNGNSNDNRIENLQILCPNCHSQTDNFGVKNIGNYANVVEQ